MTHLWTPWRMPYLRGDEPLPEGCLFCVRPQLADDQAGILHRGSLCYVILNRYPYNNGHLMVVPFAHVASLEDMDAPTVSEFMAAAQRCLQILREVYNPQGFNVGANIGTAAGAGVAGHIHLHIVPRWGGDTNFITIVGQTRVIPEWLGEMYTHLRPLFDRAGTNNDLHQDKQNQSHDDSGTQDNRRECYDKEFP